LHCTQNAGRILAGSLTLIVLYQRRAPVWDISERADVERGCEIHHIAFVALPYLVRCHSRSCDLCLITTSRIAVRLPGLSQILLVAARLGVETVPTSDVSGPTDCISQNTGPMKVKMAAI
jgi:hypothetical protein